MVCPGPQGPGALGPDLLSDKLYSLCPFPAPSCSNSAHKLLSLHLSSQYHDHQTKAIKSRTILEMNRENSPCHITPSALKSSVSLGHVPAPSRSLEPVRLSVLRDPLFNADGEARGIQLCKSSLQKEEDLRTEI